MEELTNFFENALVIRVLYPLSSDLDARGLLGKLATWKIFEWLGALAIILFAGCSYLHSIHVVA
jgi:hypothetical protein